MPCEPVRGRHPPPAAIAGPSSLQNELDDDDKGPHDDHHRCHEPEPWGGPPPVRVFFEEINYAGVLRLVYETSP